ncbi:hypothetical protein [Micrococcus sp.]|uniref:hypothetical protein n=1 Tax=Micrococcus sp. TaxID=1271 RepID=UPI002A908683|nr:hypothetical protein [Micrococcus sp.]MDY6054332.1 hypothetical protein [Micrococcus sp.]
MGAVVAAGLVVYLHGDNKPSETSTPGGTQVAAMAKAATAAGYAFALAVSPTSTWWMRGTADQSVRTVAPQTAALRSFLPALAAEVGVRASELVIVGHSGGAEAITLHLARTGVAWAGGRARFVAIGGGTPNASHIIDTPAAFRAASPILFAGSSTGDGVGATTAAGGAWSAWRSAQRGVAAYRRAGHKARLWDTGAPSHNSYDFAGIIAQALKEMP